MPKDEFDFADPFELNGVAFLTEEDTTDAMCDCFIEEFLRLGYRPHQVLALFRNPHYLGMNMVLEKRGETYIRQAITEVFARWGRPVAWPPQPGSGTNQAPSDYPPAPAEHDQCPLKPPAEFPLDASATDPMGTPVPKLSL